MPAYTFYCEKCKYKFEIICSIKDYSDKQRCEKCSNSRNVIRAYTEDLLTINSSVKKSDSELKTIGDLANRNRDKLTDMILDVITTKNIQNFNINKFAKNIYTTAEDMEIFNGPWSPI